MNKNITICFCIVFFLSSCSALEVTRIGENTIDKFDANSPERICMGAKMKEICLRNMKVLKKIKKENVRILTDLKEKKREIQRLQRDLAEQCIALEGIIVGSDCVTN